MEESDVSKCKDCGKLEIRKQDGYYPDGKNKRFVDADGLLWNGRVCGQCTRTKSKLHNREKRKKDAEPRNDVQN